jgi:hypothetical protein
MSSNDAVFILRTKADNLKLFELRVKYLPTPAIDNCDSDLLKMCCFINAKVFDDYKAAVDCALDISDERGLIEYEVRLLSIDDYFPSKEWLEKAVVLGEECKKALKRFGA